MTTNADTKTVRLVFEAAMHQNLTTLLWGRPGIGKTAFLTQWAQERGYEIEVFATSTYEPTDFLGLPYLAGQSMEYSVPSWALRAQERPTVLFFDELTTAAPATQAALLRVVNERRVGRNDVSLGETRMVLAANPQDMVLGGVGITPPLANRMVHLPWAMTFEAYKAGRLFGWSSLGQDAALDTSAENSATAKGAILAFLGHQPQMLSVDPPEGEMAFPSPRSWEMAEALLAVLPMQAQSARDLALKATVGPAAALAYMSWEVAQDLYPPEQALESPNNVPWADPRADRILALVLGVQALWADDPEGRWGAWIAFLEAATVNRHTDLVWPSLLETVKRFPTKPLSQGLKKRMKEAMTRSGLAL